MHLHGGYDFTSLLNLCALCLSLLIGSLLRSKIKFLRKYLIPAPMIGGLFLLIFYNYFARYLGMDSGREFLSDLMFHLLNISFIAMQLRIPEKTTKQHRKGVTHQNLCMLLGEYGMQATFGLIVAGTLLKKYLPGPARAIGCCLPLGFELGPGQAESMAKVWEGAPYFVQNASDVGLTMAAIGFLVGSIIGVVFINRGAKKGWISEKYIEKLRNRKFNDSGFFKDKNDRIPTSFQTTVSESMDTFSLHIGLVLLVYLISYLFLAGLEYIVAVTVGGKVLEAVQGLWGINFVLSSLFAILARKIIIASKAEHIIDNATCNRIDGVAVDLTVAACLGAIEIEAVRSYLVPIIVLSAVGIIITCFITPWMASRVFGDYSFMRFLMIFGTAAGTLPTALSLVRVVDPDFESPVAQDYANSTALMFVFALPILALVNWTAGDKFWLFVGLTSLYMVASVILYLTQAGKKAFADPKTLFYMEKKEN